MGPVYKPLILKAVTPFFLILFGCGFAAVGMVMTIFSTSRSRSLLTFSLIFLTAFGLRWTYLVLKGMLDDR